MIDYTSENILQLQRQYDMLLKSIIYSNSVEKEGIYYELNKIENNILNDTNIVYEQEYEKLANKKTSLLKEEKDRLVSLIELIENRRKYVNDIVEKHRRNVDINYDMPDILGQDKIGEYQKKIRIIDKYRQNIKLIEKLTKEIDDLKDKENKSEAKVRSNDRINRELETKMIDMLEKSFKAMEIYSYKEREKEIELAYNELSFAKEKAIQNIEGAKASNDAMLLLECEKMYDSVEEEYRKYFEKKMLLRLLYMYDRVVNNYDELLAKRDEINDILSQIDSSDFYKLVFNEINKQYNTIKLELQDNKTLKTVSEEKKSKESLLSEIKKENESDEFNSVLNELLKNEKIKQDKEEQERRKIEYEERQKKLIEDSKKLEEIRRKQKILEEERKREIEIRTREMLVKQKTGVIPKIDVKDVKKVDNNLINKLNTEEKKEVKEEKKDLFFRSSSNDDGINVNKQVSFFDKVKDDEVEKEEVNNNIVNNSFFPMQDDKNVVREEKKNNIYDSILQSNEVKSDNDEFSIPVIKNDKLVAKKVRDEKASENDVNEFMKKFLVDSKKEDVMEVKDMVFPDMPM